MTSKSVELKNPKQDVKHEHRPLKTVLLKDPYFNQEVSTQTLIGNAPVTIMNTVHQLGFRVKRVRERPGKKSTNAKKAKEAILICIGECNQYMGSVNIAG